MSARRIYLVASTGFPNYGDELVGARWLRYLARTAPDAEVWLDSPSPGNSQLLLGGLHPNVRFVDTLFRIAWAAPSEDPDELVDFAAHAVRNPGLVPRFALGVELLQSGPMCSMFSAAATSTASGHATCCCSLQEQCSAASSDVRVALTGAGLAPAAAAPPLMQQVLDGYAVVDVRDQMPRGIAADQRATVTGDDVLLDLDDDSYDRRDSRSVMVCAQSDHVDAGIEAVARDRSSARLRSGVSTAHKSAMSRPCPARTDVSSS